MSVLRSSGLFEELEAVVDLLNKELQALVFDARYKFCNCSILQFFSFSRGRTILEAVKRMS